MYGTNSMPRAPSIAARLFLVLVALCLLLSAAPCIDGDADEVCVECDQDDLIAGTGMACPRTSSLLLEQPGQPRVSPPESPVSRFPHPPTF